MLLLLQRKFFDLRLQVWHPWWIYYGQLTLTDGWRWQGEVNAGRWYLSKCKGFSQQKTFLNRELKDRLWYHVAKCCKSKTIKSTRFDFFHCPHLIDVRILTVGSKTWPISLLNSKLKTIVLIKNRCLRLHREAGSPRRSFLAVTHWFRTSESLWVLTGVGSVRTTKKTRRGHIV